MTKNDSEYQIILGKIRKLHDEKILCLHFIPVVFFETIKGINSVKAFEKMQINVRRASELCNKHIFPDTAIHLRNTAHLSSINETQEKGKNWLQIFRRLSICTNYANFKKQFEALQNEIAFKLKENHRFSINYIENRLKNIDHLAKKEQHSIIKSRIFMNCMRKTFLLEGIKHFGLESLKDNYSIDQIETKLRGLTYFKYSCANLFKKYLRPDRRKRPRESDYCDIVQTVYLDLCDYIVTSDKSFADTVNNSGCEYLEDRVILYEDFKNELDNFSLQKKALSSSNIEIPPFE
ncbi:MAG: hypothetical protein V3V99_08265 [candidate division Zixibacteria bacterium]